MSFWRRERRKGVKRRANTLRFSYFESVMVKVGDKSICCVYDYVPEEHIMGRKMILVKARSVGTIGENR